MTPTDYLAPPTNALVLDRGLQTSEVVARVRKVQEIMTTLMQENVHYGKVPGTQKPSLWKPGAELLLLTFRVGTRLEVEDLATSDAVRYRVRVIGFSQVTGEILGEGIGEASTSEERWRWRATVHEKEWAATDPDHRRIKYDRQGAETKQVRTSPTDLANTVLMMAAKRGMVAMVRIVTACSDIFDQDLEDLPTDLQGAVSSGGPRERPTVKRASETKPAPAAAATVTDARRVKDVRGAGKDKAKPTFWVLLLEGDATEYTTKDQHQALALEQFKQTDHLIRVTYESREYNGRTYHNIVSLAVVEAEPPPAPQSAAAEPLTAGEIPFGR
jgi:hypothetical protein